MGARTAFVALMHHIIAIHRFLLFFDGFGWFGMVLDGFGMVWDGLGPTTTPSTSTSTLIPRQGPLEGTSVSSILVVTCSTTINLHVAVPKTGV